jgi:hypothetical protein
MSTLYSVWIVRPVGAATRVPEIPLRGPVVYLDCQNLDTALTSFAAACRRPVAAVREAVETCTPDWSEYSPELEASGPREVFGLLNVTNADFAFEGAYYFHGTRVFDPATFSAEGILPLGRAVDRLWTSLYNLVADTVTDADWRRLRANIESGAGGHDGYLYRLKTRGPKLHGGPFAMLNRHHHLVARDGHHNYLAIPEIVEDIARCSGLDLAQRFETATTPCIVKFRTTGIDTGILHAGFWFIHGMLETGEPGWLAQCDYNGYGKAVPPEDVVAIELVSEAK